MSDIKKLPDSNAGQVTPGLEEMYYNAYCLSMKEHAKILLTFEQWQAQNRMLHCQLLGEG